MVFLLMAMAWQQTIEWQTVGKEVTTTRTQEACTLRLVLNKGDRYLQLRFSCDHSMAHHFDFVDEALKDLMNGQGIDFDQVYLGRMQHYPEMAQRLAYAASRSPSWLGLTSRSNREAYDMVIALCNQGDVYEEWHEVFARNGLKISVTSVEKVLVATLSSGHPFATFLRNKGVDEHAMLPFDAQVWFKVSTVAEGEFK